MKKYISKIVLLVGVTTLLASCKKDSIKNNGLTYKEPSLPTTTYDYKGEARKISSQNANEVDNNVATLGRVLFYEKQLSVNNLVACGSCHIQSMGFADGRQFSPGFEFLNTPRNSPAIINPGNMRNFFWDARVEDNLGAMVLMPVQNHLEMGIENLDYAVAKIEAIPYYKELFTNAWGSENVTKEKIADALTQFLRSITTTESKFDKQKNSFTELEKQGEKVYSSLHCQSCHSLSLSGGSWQSEVLANIGLDMEYEDVGVYNEEHILRNDVSFKGKFKTPSLRNIALTAPYMHDGRFATLEEVVEHYNSGVKPHTYLDWALRNQNLEWINRNLPAAEQRPIIGEPNDPAKLSLTDFEKKALIAFLRTLTDDSFTKTPIYSDPFNY